MSHTWIRNSATGASWQCPDGIVAGLLEGGWERCDPPAEPDPTTAEQAAWRAAQSAGAPAGAVIAKSTKAAAGGKSKED